MFRLAVYIAIYFFVGLGFAHAAPPTVTSATKALKTPLDSWVFGDSLDKLKQEHPNIEFVDLGDIFRQHILLRYEILNSRTFPCKNKNKKMDHQGFEFAVTLTFSSQGGKEIKKRRTYTVCKPDNWYIFGSE